MLRKIFLLTLFAASVNCAEQAPVSADDVNPFEQEGVNLDFLDQQDIAASRNLYDLSKALWWQNLVLINITKEQHDMLKPLADNEQLADGIGLYVYAFMYRSLDINKPFSISTLLVPDEGDFLHLDYIPSISCVLVHAKVHKFNELQNNFEIVDVYKLAIISAANYFDTLPAGDNRLEFVRFLETHHNDIERSFCSDKISVKAIAKAMRRSVAEVSNILESFKINGEYGENGYSRLKAAYNIETDEDSCCVIL